MADEIVRARLVVEPDQQSINRAVKSIDPLDAKIKEFQADFENTNKVTEAWRQSLSDLNRVRTFRNLAQQFAPLVANVETSQQATERLIKSFRGLKASEGEIRSVVNQMEQLNIAAHQAEQRTQRGGGTLRRFGRAARLGLPSVRIPGAGPLSSEQAARFIEGAGFAQEAFQKLGAGAKNAAVGAGILTAGLAVLAIAFAAMNEPLARQTRAVLGAQEEIIRLRETGSREEIKAAADAAAKRNELRDIEIAALERTVQQVQGTSFLGVEGLGGTLADIFNVAGAKEARERLDELKASRDEERLVIDATTTILRDSAVQRRLEAEEAAEAYEKRLEAAEKAFKKIEDLEAQRANILAGNRLETADRIVDESIAGARKLADIRISDERAAIDHQERLEQIDKQGLERLVKIRETGLKRIESADKAIQSVNTKLERLDRDTAIRRSRILREFEEDRSEQLKEYRDKEQELDAKHRRDRLRAIEDLNEQLMRAEESNDVAQFLQQERAGNTKLRRLQEDQELESAEEDEAFQKERQAREEQKAQRLADLAEDAAIRKADLEEQRSERVTAKEELIADIQAQKEAEKARIAEAEADAQAAFDKSQSRAEEDRALAQSRADADAELAQMRRDRALEAELAAIDKKVADELEAAELIGSNYLLMGSKISSAVEAAIRRVDQAAQFQVPGPPPSGNPFSLFGPQLRPPPGAGFSFRNGGIVDRPTPGIFGDVPPGFAEALIPFKKSQGLSGALGGPEISLNFGNISFNDGVTSEDFMMGMEDLKDSVRMGIEQARAGARR